MTAQLIAWQLISEKQVAVCVVRLHHQQSAVSFRTSNTPSVLQTLQSSISRGTQHLAPSFIFLSGVPPECCTSLICTHIKYCIGIPFFPILAILLSKQATSEGQKIFFCIAISWDEGGRSVHSLRWEKFACLRLCELQQHMYIKKK